MRPFAPALLSQALCSPVSSLQWFHYFVLGGHITSDSHRRSGVINHWTKELSEEGAGLICSLDLLTLQYSPDVKPLPEPVPLVSSGQPWSECPQTPRLRHDATSCLSPVVLKGLGPRSVPAVHHSPDQSWKDSCRASSGQAGPQEGKGSRVDTSPQLARWQPRRPWRPLLPDPQHSQPLVGPASRKQDRCRMTSWHPGQS